MARYLIACDAGGTMTDVIVVHEDGRFVIGKAPTTPFDESQGFAESLEDALSYWGISLEKEGHEVCEATDSAIYTGTSMLNAVINMSGLKTGLITTRGFEDVLVQGRGSQSFIGCDWPEITHMQYRKHRQPLVPRRLTRGVTERIDMFGNVVIPLYEHEVERAAEELLDEGVQALAIVFLQSYVNPQHELRAKEIVEGVLRRRGVEIPVIASSQVAPVIREVSRANATVLQAFAAEPARKQLFGVEARIQQYGHKRALRTVLSYGGVTNIRYDRLFETIVSGPVGGVMGAYHLGKALNIENLVCSDMGGTSFDVACITAGVLPMDREPPFQQMYVNVPMIDIRSIGAGTGTYIRVDPETRRIRLGPDSAGGYPGPVFYNMGNLTPTVGDCDLILGILNEHNYLGGRIKVYKDLAFEVFKEKVADPLGLDVYTAAEACVDLINLVMREHLVRTVMLGYDPRDYVLLGYGGAGPMHLAGYAGDYPWRGVATVPWAAAFSAWGCACMDYSHRRHRSISAVVPHGAGEAEKEYAGRIITSTWEALEKELLEELTQEGFSRDRITFRQIAYVRYYGHLFDVEVESPLPRLASAQDVDRLLERFEHLFTRMYTLAGKPGYPTYAVTEVAVVAQVDTPKPVVRRYDLEGPEPPRQALKEKRQVFQGGRWQPANIYEMSELRPGNVIEGLAVIEAPSTTLFVPEQWRVRIDEYEIYWLERK